MQNNRRRFVLGFTACLLGVASKRAALAESDEKLAERYYDDAVTMLKNGHWYQRAVDKLSFCVKQSPDVPAYHLALGCARASLLASHCAALRDRSKRRLSPEEVNSLLANHKENHPDGSVPTPDEIRDFLATPDSDNEATVLVLPDSNRVVVYNDVSLRSKLHELATDAESAWKQAVSLAHTDAEKEELLTTQAWGLKLLMLSRGSLSAQGFATAFPAKQSEEWQEAMIASANAVTDLVPDRAKSWALKGEALIGLSSILWTASGEELEQTYEKALNLEPENPAILFRLYQITTAGEKQGRGEMYLGRFVGAQKGNVYARFCLAGHLAMNVLSNATKLPRTAKQEQREIDEIIRIVDQGVLLSSYRPAPSVLEPPPTLRPSTGLFASPIPISVEIREEFSSIGRLVLQFAKARADSDPVRAKRYCRSVISLAKRVSVAMSVGRGSNKISDGSKCIMNLHMGSLARPAYKTLLSILEKEGDTRKLAEVEQEQKEFIARSRYGTD